MPDAAEPLIRLGIFAAVFAAMASWELLAPKRGLTAPKGARWLTNIAIAAIDAAMLRFLFPVLAVGVAIWADGRGLGLFAYLAWPAWLEVLVALVVLDFAIWAQHLVFHKVPVLWRIHRVHHVDRDIDVTTAVRFHPVEIALSMLIKFAVVIALGAPAIAVFAFEVILNGLAMFNHANVSMPGPLDRLLRLVIVTPDMHRVHHSVRRPETDSNYGFNLSVWDRLFGTYRAQPEGGHLAMRIGLSGYGDERPIRLGWSLMFPFRDGTGREALPRPRASREDSA